MYKSTLFSGSRTARLILVSILLAILAGACAPIPDGQVTGMFSGSTLRGMQEAVRGAPGTHIFARGSVHIFLWQIHDGYAFVISDPAREMGKLQGNFASTRTVSDFSTFIKSLGFEKIAPAAVSKDLASAILGGTSGALSAATSLVTVLVVPAGTLNPFEDIYNQVWGAPAERDL